MPGISSRGRQLIAYHGLGGFALHAMSPWLLVTLPLVVVSVRAIATLARRAPPAVVFISTHAIDARVVRRLEGAGYAQVSRTDHSPQARLIVLQRPR